MIALLKETAQELGKMLLEASSAAFGFFRDGNRETSGSQVGSALQTNLPRGKRREEPCLPRTKGPRVTVGPISQIPATGMDADWKSMRNLTDLNREDVGI